MLKMYARRNDPTQPNSRGIPFGVILIGPNPSGSGPLSVGWSQCSKHDQFSKKKGMMIAEGRYNSDCSPLHNSMTTEMGQRVLEAIHEFAANPDRYS